MGSPQKFQSPCKTRFDGLFELGLRGVLAALKWWVLGRGSGKEEKGNGCRPQFVISATVEEADGLLLQQQPIIIIILLHHQGRQGTSSQYQRSLTLYLIWSRLVLYFFGQFH